MNKVTLAESEQWSIANALRCAADAYRDYASLAIGARTRKAFEAQEARTRAMAARIESAFSITLVEDTLQA